MFLESSWIGGVRSGFPITTTLGRVEACGRGRTTEWGLGVPGCLANWEVTFLRGAWLFVLDDREEQDLGVGSFLVTFGVGGGDSHDSGIWGAAKENGIILCGLIPSHVGLLHLLAGW
ncbi:hypothetical protein GQ607_012142 [Colletotrichum asianum]|uniref:Uncharacterized protein n=1 Tax=Colletotrichum asianum TaxID=702518 RepID=A0A8H3ZNT4_9PEZI|nr:hypothetical protein GQ607_012142 [Colletotrichum asianum]